MKSKRNRSKNTPSPTKRGRYRKHSDRDAVLDLVEACSERFEETGKVHGVVTWVFDNKNPTNVARRTLAQWWHRLRNADDPDAFLKSLSTPGCGRGGHNRIFTEHQERHLAIAIVMWFTDNNVPFTNEDFVLFALEYYYKNIGRVQPRARQWKGYAGGSIADYKQRWGFVTKRPRISHVAKNPNLEAQMAAYRVMCGKWIRHVGAALFFNYDETFWRLVQGVLACWGRKGINTTIDTYARDRALRSDGR